MTDEYLLYSGCALPVTPGVSFAEERELRQSRLMFHFGVMPVDWDLVMRAQAATDLQAGMAEMLGWDVLDVWSKHAILCWLANEPEQVLKLGPGS